jgi:hypothetical protein
MPFLRMDSIILSNSSSLVHSSDSDERNYEEKKEHMKAVKQQVRENAIERQQNEEAYIMLSFSSYNTKSDFCDLLGISTDDKFTKGEDVLKLIK